MFNSKRIKRLEIKTVYENVDAEWLDWWLQVCGPNYGVTLAKINSGIEHKFVSKDPMSDVIGTTTVRLTDFVCENVEAKEAVRGE